MIAGLVSIVFGLVLLGALLGYMGAVLRWRRTPRPDSLVVGDTVVTKEPWELAGIRILRIVGIDRTPEGYHVIHYQEVGRRPVFNPEED
jgi:hypothetical protein